MVDASRVEQIIGLLKQLYPSARCELDFSDPFQLLLATMLSAQCTDTRVNQVTPTLFAKFKHPCELMLVTAEDLEEDIRSCGLYRTKAKNILACSREICLRYGGKVPSTREQLEQLPGVGRKTANVVVYNAFTVPALAVDTHVYRVARRLQLARANTPEKVEQELCAIIPEKHWGEIHHLLIWHGRRVCSARNPSCPSCALNNLCPHFKEMNRNEQSPRHR